MKKFSSVDEVLNVAIASESKAHQLYVEMAAMVENPWIRTTLESFAQEELRHRAKLIAVKSGRITLEREKVSDLGIADTLEEAQPHAKMDYPELLAFAIKKEDSAHKLYAAMASIFSEPDLKDMFNNLAEEEAAHKRRFEIEYDSITF